MRMPKYLYEARLVPLSKNKDKDQAKLKDIRLIVVRSHVAKVLEKAIMAKVAALAPHLLLDEDLLKRLQAGHLDSNSYFQTFFYLDSPWAGQ